MNVASSRLSPRWVWVVALVPLFVLTGRVIVTDENFAFRDAAHYYYPQFAWEDRQWRAGTVPLWNPQDNLGVSVAADPTASLFYPGKLLFRLPLAFATKYKLYTLAHLCGAAFGAYVLARVWRCSRPAAVLAAISYACGGNVLFLYSNVVYLVGAAWLPWGLAALEGLASGSATLAASLGLSAALAMMILGGDPQTAAHVLLIGLLRVCFASCLLPLPSPAPSRSGIARWGAKRRGRALLVVAAGAAAFGLSAAQAVPTLLASRHSGRAAFEEPRSVWEIIPWLRTGHAEPVADVARGLVGPPREDTHHSQLYDFSVGPWRLVELLVPNVFGRMFPRYARWGFAIPAEGRIWTPSLYQGLLPALLALTGILVPLKRPRDATERWLVWTTALTILGGCGSYGLGWLAREICGDLGMKSPGWLGDATGGVYWLLVTCVPGYVQFRYPAKLWTIAALTIAGLAARALDRATMASDAGSTAEVSDSLHSHDGARMRKWLRRLAGTLVIATAGMLVALAVTKWTGWWVEALRGVADDPWLGPLDVSRAHADTVWALASTLITSTLAWYLATRAGHATSPSRLSLLRWMWIVVTMVDLVVAHRWLVATATPDAWSAGARALETVARQRYWRAGGAGALPAEWERTSSSDRLVDTVRWDAATLFSKMHLLGEACSIDAPAAAESQDYVALLQVARAEGQAVGESGLELPRTLRDMLGVGATIAPVRPVDSAAQPLVALAPATARRAWIVRDVELLAELQSHSPTDERRRAREVLFPPGRERDWNREAVAESDAWHSVPDPPPRDNRDADQVRLLEEELHRVRVEVELPSPALLVLADRFDEDWRVDVRDSRQQRLSGVTQVRTNRVCRGVWLPAGHWTVEFRYGPTGVNVGLVVSAFHWLVWLALMLRMLARRESRLTAVPASGGT